VKVLLDTCALLWLIDAPRRFSAAAAAALQHPDAVLYASHASHASLWEIVLKYRVGKLDLPKPPREYWAELVETWVLTELQITPDVLFQVGNIPLHHKDPFDHILVAHAQLSGLHIVSSDPMLPTYGVPIIW
jgi:PIN domain nuclease of toxin-antitoxin system